MDKNTIKNAGIGSLVALVLTFVPLLSMIAPLVGGGVAGYRERDGPEGGLLTGALAGAFVAVGGVLIRTGAIVLRFGIEGVPPVQGVPLSTLLAGFFVGIALMLLSTLGTVVVAGIGGGLGGLLEQDRARRRAEEAVSNASPGDRSGTRRVVTAVVSLLGGVVSFLAVTLGVTAALDPYVWPSALVGFPVGAIAGVAVAVLANHVLTTRRENCDQRGRAPGVQ